MAFPGLKIIAAAICGGLAGAVDDSTILLQADPVHVKLYRDVPTAVQLAGQEDDSWPDFGKGVWDSVKESVKEVTQELGDVVSGEKSLRNVLYNKSVETAAIVFAQSLAEALVVVDNATKKLKNRTTAQKVKLLQKVNDTSVVDLMNATLQQALSNYRRVRSVLSTAGTMIASSLERAGQPGMSAQFKQLYDAGLAYVDQYVGSLMNASKDIQNFLVYKKKGQELTGPIVKEKLVSADSYLQKATAMVPQFAASINGAFQGAVDETLDALPEASSRVQSAFSNVMGNVSDTVFQLRSSSRDLTQTCHTVLALVAAAFNVTLPAWQGPTGALPPVPAAAAPGAATVAPTTVAPTTAAPTTVAPTVAPAAAAGPGGQSGAAPQSLSAALGLLALSYFLV